MTKTHEQIPLLQIPLLAKLLIYYYCDECLARIKLGWFYQGIDEVIEAASVEDGKLICPGCRDLEKKCLCHFDVDNPIGTERFRIIHKDCPIHNER